MYLPQIEPAIRYSDNHTYAGAIKWLEKVRPLFGLLSREDEFDELVEDLRGRHRAKRNFMKRLDKQGWGVRATERAADARSANNALHS